MEEQPKIVVDNVFQQISETEVEGAKARGIDVSKWQGEIMWSKVADSNVKHVFIKMSEGGTYVDPNFVTNWNGAQKAGLNVNCYHYFRALSSLPKAQMENIKKNLKLVEFNPAKNILGIDVELKSNEKATPKEMADNLNALLNLIKSDAELSQLSVFIYTSPDYWNFKVNWKDYDFSAYGLWVAHYKVHSPRIPQPWKSRGKTWAWWQYSNEGKIDGISGFVDLNWVAINK